MLGKFSGCILASFFYTFIFVLPNASGTPLPTPSIASTAPTVKTSPSSTRSPIASASPSPVSTPVPTATPNTTPTPLTSVTATSIPVPPPPPVDNECPWAKVDEVTIRSGSSVVTIDRNNPCQCPEGALSNPINFCAFDGDVGVCSPVRGTLQAEEPSCKVEKLPRSDEVCGNPHYDSLNDTYNCDGITIESATECERIQGNPEENPRELLLVRCGASESEQLPCTLKQGAPYECTFISPYQVEDEDTNDDGWIDTDRDREAEYNPWANDPRCLSYSASSCGIPLADTEVDLIMGEVARGNSIRMVLETMCAFRTCLVAPEQQMLRDAADGLQSTSQQCVSRGSCVPKIVSEILGQDRQE